MKEIKLQFWNRKSKTMSVPYSLADLAYEGFPNQYKNEHEDVLDEECDVLQYTGLKDKNGKEIYEGDIIRSYEKVTTIIWLESEGGFYARTLTGECFKYYHNSIIEIIGNIYENPNLLQDSTKGVTV